MSKKISKTNQKQLKKIFSYKEGNLGFTLLGLFYIIFPWFSNGVIDQVSVIFGLVFLTVSVMRAKPSNSVIAGLCQGFIGITYAFAIANLVNVAILWIVTLILAAVFFILELGFVKIGPITAKADGFQAVPLTFLTFSLGLSVVGYSTLFIVSWATPLVALNFIAVLLFSLFALLQVTGWSVAGRNTNLMLVLFAVGAIACAVLGVYQGTLFQWT